MSARPVPDWLTRWEFAHRGLHGAGVPENSLAAAKGAIARGMGIECDIQMSADGAAMVFHDWELSRLTGAIGLVAMFSADALGALGLLGTDQRPPRLEALLDLIAGQVPLLIEVKSMPGYDVARSCAAVAARLADYQGAVAVMSFDPRVPEWFADAASPITRGLVGTDSFENGFEGVWRTPEAIAAAQPDFLAIDVRDLHRPEAAAWRAGGGPLLTWTVRSPETRATGLALADALIAEGEGLA
ncbi:glycerophosphodiester phosphodiesterase family protein [Erythrobacter sp. BLCC-B19]|uniref:glycerophosphodiester phosphodiesterase family protein n=1 Tax=Erythrobacter sp. BLCC-B19 TaxID=3025315 RepID=UPI00235E1DA7|nr:glycerophosphodiester phosphodiesterase family protein [Erythrobacter sp. BLCC-B19]WDA42135.1 glycerophosphodiester phosphodiesterase family protein [Erythrobacter sp. BLCC-B19]